MSDRTNEPSEALQAAAAKRIQLKEALSRVEVAAASPSAAAHWRTRLLAELEILSIALSEHVEEVGGDFRGDGREHVDDVAAEAEADGPEFVGGRFGAHA